VSPPPVVLLRLYNVLVIVERRQFIACTVEAQVLRVAQNNKTQRPQIPLKRVAPEE
jgi:hypothetical protein